MRRTLIWKGFRLFSFSLFFSFLFFLLMATFSTLGKHQYGSAFYSFHVPFAILEGGLWGCALHL
ncbi:hypothetical protein V8C42DRAFT_12963 [Trichoderma barbatum]